MARILIGVSGGIAAYKAVELARLATQAGHGVRVTMTDAAARFVGAATFEGITGAPVLVDEFSRDPLRGTYPGDELPAHDPISHLAVVERADAFVVAPASANTLAKLAAGICDSLLTTSFLACPAPRIVAPAMNGRMWEAAATGANVATLRERGVEVMEPGEGALASRGEHGRGRMPEPEEILAAIEAAIGANPADLAGRRVLVTAGGTREPIDPVRFVGNRSSGRMGVALAEAAARRGAEVTLIAANVALPVAAGVERVDVTSAAELEDATAKAFGGADLLLMAAAVADFRPADPNPRQAGPRGGVRADDRARADRGRPRRPRREPSQRSGPRRLRCRARRRLRRPRARQARAQADRRDRGQRRLRQRDRLRVARQRGDDRLHRRRGAAPARFQARSRRRDPRPGGRAPLSAAMASRSALVPTLAPVKDVLILGSTGSIGEQAIDVAGRSAEIRIAGLSADSSWERLLAQADAAGVATVALADADAAAAARESGWRGTVLAGRGGGP